MADDARTPSLSEHVASLERQVRELQEQASLVPHLQRQVGELASGWRQIGWVLDKFEKQIGENSQDIPELRGLLEDLARVLEVQHAAVSPDAQSVPAGGEAFRRAVEQAKSLHRHRVPPAGRHLRLVRGGMVAALIGAAGHWSLRKTVVSGAVALAGLGTVLSPDMMAQHAPAAALPHSGLYQQLQPQPRPRLRPRQVPGAVAAPARRCHDRTGDHDTFLLLAAQRRVCRDRDPVTSAQAAAAVPASSPSPSPSMTPSPSPSITPSPSPTCTPMPPSGTPASSPAARPAGGEGQ